MNLQKRILMLLLFFGVCLSTNLAYSQNRGKEEIPVYNSDSLLFKYVQVLKDDASAHRHYIESFYTKISAFGGAIVLILTASFVWFNYKTFEKARESVEKKIEAVMISKIDNTIKEKIVYFSHI